MHFALLWFLSILCFCYRFKLRGALISIGAGIIISTVISITVIAVKDLPALISIAWLPNVSAEDR